MPFTVDEQIRLTCFELGDGPVSKIFFKNNTDYPWLILVPKVDNIKELDQLPSSSRYLLMDEICQISQLVRTYFKSDKINVGSLGNIVSQLHVHVIGRTKGDKLWPHSVWQATEITLYDGSTINSLIEDLSMQIKLIFEDSVALA